MVGYPPHLHNGGVCPYTSPAPASAPTAPVSSPTSTKTQTTPSKPKTVYAESIETNLNNVELLIGVSEKVEATISPSNTTNKTITWISNNEEIVSVNSDGTIIAKGVGKTTVVVKTSNGKEANIDVTVLPIKVNKIELSESKVNLKLKETKNISATVYPEDATDKTLLWSIENVDIASIEDEVITPKKAGTTKVICSSKDGIKSEVELIVEEEKVVTEEIKEDKKTDTIVSQNNVEPKNEGTKTNTPSKPMTGLNLWAVLGEIILLIYTSFKLKDKDATFSFKQFAGNILSYGISIFSLGFVMISTSIMGLIISILTSLSVAPPVCKIINSKFDNKYTVKIRIITYCVLFVFSSAMI